MTNEQKTTPEQKPKINKKIGSYIATGITVALAAFLILFIIIQTASPTLGVKVFGFKTYLVADTKSMEPMLKYNDFIVTKKTDFDKIDVDDIITFRGVIVVEGKAVNATITHKVVEIIINDETGVKSLRTQGINKSTNPIPDTRLVTKEGGGGTNLYIGEYAFRVPVLGAIIAFFRSPYGIITLTLNVIIIVVIVFLIKKDKPDSGKNAEEGQPAEASGSDNTAAGGGEIVLSGEGGEDSREDREYNKEKSEYNRENGKDKEKSTVSAGNDVSKII